MFYTKAIQTTVFTSLQAKLCIMAEPISWSVGHVANRQCTDNLVVALMFDVGVLLYVHSDMYNNHSDELTFSNRLHICKWFALTKTKNKKIICVHTNRAMACCSSGARLSMS